MAASVPPSSQNQPPQSNRGPQGGPGLGSQGIGGPPGMGGPGMGGPGMGGPPSMGGPQINEDIKVPDKMVGLSKCIDKSFLCRVSCLSGNCW